MIGKLASSTICDTFSGEPMGLGKWLKNDEKRKFQMRLEVWSLSEWENSIASLLEWGLGVPSISGKA